MGSRLEPPVGLDAVSYFRNQVFTCESFGTRPEHALAKEVELGARFSGNIRAHGRDFRGAPPHVRRDESETYTHIMETRVANNVYILEPPVHAWVRGELCRALTKGAVDRYQERR